MYCSVLNIIVNMYVLIFVMLFIRSYVRMSLLVVQPVATRCHMLLSVISSYQVEILIKKFVQLIEQKNCETFARLRRHLLYLVTLDRF